MPLSMTGFGSAKVNSSHWQVKCDVQCLNKKHIDLVINLPKSLIHKEISLRKIASDRLSRGKISINFDVRALQNEKKVTLNEDLLDLWVTKLNEISQRYESSWKMDAGVWLGVNEIWNVSEQRKNVKEVESLLEKSLNKAIDNCILMRKREGRALVKDMKFLLSSFEKNLTVVSKRIPKVVAAYEKKIQEKVKFNKSRFDEKELDIFHRFISVFSEKIDVREEVIRLKSHIVQLKGLLKNEKERVGRPMDFLLQEFNREANTIASKIQDPEVSVNTVKMKTLIEQIREQCQNLL